MLFAVDFYNPTRFIDFGRIHYAGQLYNLGFLVLMTFSQCLYVADDPFLYGVWTAKIHGQITDCKFGSALYKCRKSTLFTGY